MNTKTLTLIVIVGFILILGGCGCNGYNNMVKLDETTKQKWGAVESSYQRRMDLIPNLVNTVKGAANFEQKTLTDVIQARASASQVKIDANNLTPDKIAAFQQAQNNLGGTLSRLLVVTENYPQLRATENFTALQTQLEGTENRIKAARDDFNVSVQDYNSVIRRFPNNLFAHSFGFKAKGYFDAAPGADKTPTVDFNK